MPEKEFFQDKNYLCTQQYRDASNLDARVNLHRLYSTNPLDWQQWVFDQMALQPGMKVLECGCGPGWLWRNNLDRLPENCQITLSDFSDGMVAEAKAALVNSGHDFRFQTVNIEEMPFADDSFDVVVANHMLYHVPNLAAALAEVRRVLKTNGHFDKLSAGDFDKLSAARFYAATNGPDHMREVRELAIKLAPETARLEWPEIPFRLDNGRSLLASTFNHIHLTTYEDSLEVTAVEPLMAYVQSMTLLPAIEGGDETACTEPVETAVAKTNELANYLAQEIAANGAYHITKSSGLFTAY